MKIEIYKFGKPAFCEYESLIDTYASRLKAQVRFHLVKDSKTTPLSSAQLESHIPKFKKRSHCLFILLDECGALLSSRELAHKISDWRHEPSIKEVIFLVGGPYGFNKQLQKNCDLCLSLSKATLTSDLAWLVLVEQIYRSFQILQGHSYHHD